MGRKGKIVGPKKTGRDGGGLHFGKDGRKSGGKAGPRKKSERSVLILEMEKGGVKNRFQSHEDAVGDGDRFVERVDGGVMEAGISPDAFGKNGGAGGWNEKLDLAFELMMFGPVKTAEGMRPRGGEKGVRAKGATGKVFH